MPNKHKYKWKCHNKTKQIQKQCKYKIIHQRDIDEIFVNNYNKEWIKSWNSNMDIQITLDHFAIVTYITDYMQKDDTGTMEFIVCEGYKGHRKTTIKRPLKNSKEQFSYTQADWRSRGLLSTDSIISPIWI